MAEYAKVVIEEDNDLEEAYAYFAKIGASGFIKHVRHLIEEFGFTQQYTTASYILKVNDKQDFDTHLYTLKLRLFYPMIEQHRQLYDIKHRVSLQFYFVDNCFTSNCRVDMIIRVHREVNLP